MTDQTARAFTALADPTRREIFERVAERPQAVGELADRLPSADRPSPSTSRCSPRRSCVTPRAEGTRRIYAVDPQGLAGLRDYLDGFWNRSLAAYARAAEEHTHTRQEHR